MYELCTSGSSGFVFMNYVDVCVFVCVYALCTCVRA